MKKHIKISYEVISDESAEEGDVEDRGWEDEEGVECASLQEAIEFLQNSGASEFSCSVFSPNGWYSYYGERSPIDGKFYNKDFHLYSFSVKQEKRIYNQICRGGKKQDG